VPANRHVSPPPRLILASASPRRQTLLRDAGYEFLVHPADIDEEAAAGKRMPIELAAALAALKAEAVARRFAEDVTLAADTVVAFGDTPLGKPVDEAAARDMLRLLSGTTHIVITGLVIRCPAREIELAKTVMSAVRMRRLSPADIDGYVQTGLWKGKAGGYGIQDRDPLVTCISGSHTNVIGLPVAETRALLERAGVWPRRGDGRSDSSQG
jgi:septum formation protein